MHINRPQARMRGLRAQGGVSVRRSDMRKVVREQGRCGLIKYMPAFVGFGNQFFLARTCAYVRVCLRRVRRCGLSVLDLCPSAARKCDDHPPTHPSALQKKSTACGCLILTERVDRDARPLRWSCFTLQLPDGGAS